MRGELDLLLTSLHDLHERSKSGLSRLEKRIEENVFGSGQRLDVVEAQLGSCRADLGQAIDAVREQISLSMSSLHEKDAIIDDVVEV